MEMWLGEAEYRDGTRIKKRIPYSENGNYHLECATQQGIESYLVEAHEDCVWYSVVVVDD